MPAKHWLPLEHGIMVTKTNAVLIAVAALLGIAASSIAIDAGSTLRGDKWYDNTQFAIASNTISVAVFLAAGLSLAAQVLDFEIPLSGGAKAVF